MYFGYKDTTKFEDVQILSRKSFKGFKSSKGIGWFGWEIDKSTISGNESTFLGIKSTFLGMEATFLETQS